MISACAIITYFVGSFFWVIGGITIEQDAPKASVFWILGFLFHALAFGAML